MSSDKPEKDPRKRLIIARFIYFPLFCGPKTYKAFLLQLIVNYNSFRMYFQTHTLTTKYHTHPHNISKILSFMWVRCYHLIWRSLILKVYSFPYLFLRECILQWPRLQTSSQIYLDLNPSSITEHCNILHISTPHLLNEKTHL